jgi:hypothetical protein
MLVIYKIPMGMLWTHLALAGQRPKPQQSVLTLRFATRLGLFVLAMALATTGEAAHSAPPDAAAIDQCLEQVRSGRTEWIECYGSFETDSGAQAELSKQTFDIVRSAKCDGAIRLRRAALTNALTADGVLELDPQDVLCSLTTGADANPQISITYAPKVSFQSKRVVDVSPRIMRITSLPEFMVAPLRAAGESGFVRSQLTKRLNAFLEQAFPK